MSSIDSAFEKYHSQNPQVYDMFKEQVYRAIRLKREKFSANAIINWLRWEVAMRIKTDDTYKINNNFSSRYARLFVKENPHYEHMFEFREIRSGTETIKKSKLSADLKRILCILLEGGTLYYHTDNNTVGLVDHSNQNKDITTIQFNKLKQMHLICQAGQQTLLTHQYQLSSKGKQAA